jgi:hypothetical protein
MSPEINHQLAIEHRWLAIGALLDNLMAREAREMELQGMKDHDISAMLVERIDKALTEEFGQPPLTESDIIKLIQGIDIITIVAEEKMANGMRQ